MGRAAEGSGDLGFPGGGANRWRAGPRAGRCAGCAHLPVSLPPALQPPARAMGRLVLLLLLAFLMPGLPIPVPPALKALSNLHLSTSSTSLPSVVMNYSIRYFEQKVRLGKGLGRDWGFAGSRPADGTPARHRSPPGISGPVPMTCPICGSRFLEGGPPSPVLFKISPPGTSNLLSVLAPYSSVIDSDRHFESFCSLRML